MSDPTATPETDALIKFGREEDMRRKVDDIGHYMAQVNRLSTKCCLLERERNALRKRVAELENAVATERAEIIAMIPGGSICDPQQVCDMIRSRKT